jgi:hypothetical protein
MGLMLDNVAGLLLIVTRRVSRLGGHVMRWVAGLTAEWVVLTFYCWWAGGAGCTPLCGEPALSLLSLVAVTLLLPLMLVQLALLFSDCSAERADDYRMLVLLTLFLGACLVALNGATPADHRLLNAKRHCRLRHN